MNRRYTKPSVLDIFCGAGGFSEGFRQQGYKIVMGIDSWKPATETFNFNFNVDCVTKNILELSIKDMENLPNTQVIIGSPPCVSFSNSNRSGKADKSLGLRLTETFLRIITIKKFRRNSKLKAWFMENVPNSLKYLKKKYSFKSLGLADWATQNGIDPSSLAIQIEGNSIIINSAEFGSPQSRKRAITGEIIKRGKLVVPVKTHGIPSATNALKKYKTLAEVRRNLPSPYSTKSKLTVTDPIYDLQIELPKLTDQFYDTGLYDQEWRSSKFHKVNHPYMGRMSFPEKENRPSRTITAMNIGTSRETMIFRSELKRKGNGEYRLPTVREMACIMGFPITFQFFGSESSKTRLVGNAVCPSVGNAFARLLRTEMGLRKLSTDKIQKAIQLNGVPNLNTFLTKKFDKPPEKKKGSRFRKHPFKYGNITVTLSNYNIDSNSSRRKWKTSVQYGNGNGFPSNNYPDFYFKKLEKLITKFEGGANFLKVINNGFTEMIAKGTDLQRMYESQRSVKDFIEPTKLVEEVARIINGIKFKEDDFSQTHKSIFKHKKTIPKKQLMALYAINKIATVANEK